MANDIHQDDPAARSFSESLLDSIRNAHERFLTSEDPSVVFKLLLQSLISLTNSEYGFLDEVLHDDKGKLYKLSLALSDISWDADSRKLYNDLVARNLEFRNLNNLSGAPALSGKLVIANDAPHDPRSGGLPAGHPSIQAFMGLPLTFGGELVGVAGVANRPGGYDEDLAKALEPFLSTCASMIQATRQREKEKAHVKQMEDANQMMAAILGASPESSFLIDRNGVVLNGNEVFASRLGRSIIELLGKNVFSYLPVALAESRRKKLNELLQFGKPVHFEDVKNDRIYSHHMFPIRDDNGAINRVAIFGADITEQRRAEEERRESLLREAEAVKAANVGFWDWDLKTDRVHYSAEWKRQIGYEDHEICDDFEEWRSRVHPDDLEDTVATVQENIRNLCQNFETRFRFRHKDGSYRWVLAQGSVFGDENGHPVRMLGSHTDITRLVMAEEQARSHRRELELTVDATTNGIWKWNFITHEMEFSPRYYTMLGYEPNEFPASYDTWTELIHPEDLEHALLVTSDFLKTKPDEYENDFRLRTKNGDYRWIKSTAKVVERTADGEAVRMIGNHVDVSGKKWVEDRNSALAEMLDSAPNTVTIHDADGRFVYANSKTFDLHGYTPEEFFALNLHELDVPESEEKIEERIREILETGEATFEVGHYRKDGSVLPLEVSVKPIAWEGRDGFLSIGRDITERKQAHKALLESEQRVREKLNAVISPEGDIEGLELGDIIDAPEIQRIMADFHRLSNIGIAILDNTGKVLVATGWQDICTKYHRVNPETCQNCMESDLTLSKDLVPGELRQYRCKNNMWDIATPIFVGEKRLGTLYLGQFFYEDESIDRDLFHKQARKYGFDTEEYLNALDRVPRWSKETVERVMRFYIRFADLVSTQGYSSLKLARTLHQMEQTQKTLRESESSYRALTETIPDLLFKIDKYLRFVFIHAGLKENLLVPKDQALNKTVYDLLPPELAEMTERNVKAVLDTGETREYEYSLHMEGGYNYYEARMVPCTSDEVLALVRNVTEQKRAEGELRESEQRHRDYIMNTPYGVFITNEKGKYLQVNPAATLITGYSEEELLSMSVSDILPEEGVKGGLAHFQQVVTAGKAQGELLFLHKSGEVRWWSVSGVKLSDTRFLGFCNDITDRKQAEESLRRSENTFRAAFHTSPDSININRLSDGLYLDVNEGFLRIMGYERGEVLGKSSIDLDIWHDPKDRNRLVDSLKRDGIIENLEAKFRRKDGSLRDGLMSARIIDLGGEPCILSMTRDITDLKQAVMQLKQSQLLLEKLFASIPDMLSVQDKDLNIVYSNWHGFGAVEQEKRTPGSKCYRTYRGLDAQCQDCEAAQVLATGEPIMVQKRILEGIWAEVRAFPIENENGEIEYLVEWVRDISEIKNSEKALIDSEERFRSITEQSGDVISLTDIDGIIRYISHASRLIFGLEPDDMLGRHFVEFLDESSVSKALESFQTTLEGGVLTKNIELLMKRSDGSSFVGELNGSLFGQGETQGTLVVIRDITERKQAETENKKPVAQLQQAMKMEAVGRLAGGVAHDFNNLLTSITGNVQLSLMDLRPGDPMEDALMQIAKAADSAAALTRQLLAFSRKQLIEPKVLNLNELVSSLHKMLIRLIGEDIRLKTIPAKRLGSVKVDPGQFEQILVNLAVNARDAMPDGGELIIETANVELDEEYCRLHSHSTTGAHVMVAVSDTGIGMSQDVKSHLFEPFFTTKPKGRGTGLGLATIYGAVKQMGGSVEVYSEEGEGTTFKIYLPTVAEKAERLRSAATNIEMPGGSETVLIVEDEKSVRETAIRILKRLGYNVLQAPDGGQAFMLAEKYTDRIDLLMTDVVMPGMNGRQLAERLVKIHPEMDVLYTSGYTENAIAHHGVIDVGLHFIGKPYTPQGLAKKLREVLEH